MLVMCYKHSLTILLGTAVRSSTVSLPLIGLLQGYNFSQIHKTFLLSGRDDKMCGKEGSHPSTLLAVFCHWVPKVRPHHDIRLHHERTVSSRDAEHMKLHAVFDTRLKSLVNKSWRGCWSPCPMRIESVSKCFISAVYVILVPVCDHSVAGMFKSIGGKRTSVSYASLHCLHPSWPRDALWRCFPAINSLLIRCVSKCKCRRVILIILLTLSCLRLWVTWIQTRIPFTL